MQSTSEYQTEVEIELDVEEEKAAEIKNQVQTAKNSPEAQQHRPATASKEVAEMQQEWRDSGETVSKFKLQRTQELTRTQHEDGKQDAWNGHAQVASQAMAVPEEYGPDAERQEDKRDEEEFRTAQQGQEDDLGQSRVIINEYESDKTSRTKQCSQLQSWKNHSLNATRKEVDKKM